ncbi:unnamed protein product [Schistosoma rodhaini]|uniref:SH3 domain-containing protein n=1 Tax=Schistosoma rodhaini TaxID=6188 RepID=A0AA85FML2_9TREM|nr:unnamed protein product [Schistosoma rodhaini]
MVQLSSWVGIWDQATNFIKYHDIGINLHERLYKFLIDFAKLQKDAYIAQKRLCEKYLSDAQKCFGVSNSYVSFFNELVQIVQHIVDAENLISCSFEIHAGSEGKSIIEDERRQFKRWKSERSKLSTELKSQTRIIDDEIKRYRDKYRDMIKAKEDYERINADQSHSQFDVEKALNYTRLKEIDFERARKDYSAALNQFNLYRQDYYFRCLPSWAQVGKSLEVERYTRTQSLINILYERLRVAIDRMNSVCDEFKSVCTNLNSDQDSEEMIKYLHSNNPPPGDIAFVDLYSSSVNNSTIQSTVKQPTYPKQQRTNSSEPIYSSGSVVLPSNFHCSVWAADNAALESSKQCGSDNNNSNNNYVSPSSTSVGESIYGESGSIYCASYASTTSTNGSHNGGVGSNCSRRPSVSDNYTALNLRNSSISINGAGFLRRIFSRRSRHDSLNVNCEINSDEDGVVSGWSNPLFEPVVPWRRSARQYQRHQYKTRRIHSFRMKFSRHRRTTDYNDNNDNYNYDRICIKSPLDIRASQSTGDLSVVNLKSVADLCEPARIKHQKTNDQITCLFDSKRRATHNSRITGNISRSRDNSVVDPSDFSDSNSELGNNVHGNKTTINNNTYRRQLRIHSTTDSDNVAYASTSVLNGLPQSMASSCQSPDAPKGAAVAAVLPVTTITTITTTHTPSSSLYSRSDSQAIGLSSGHERSSIPLYYLSTSGKSKPMENGGSSKQLLKQDKLFTAPLAEPETGSIVTPVESFSQSTLTSSLSQLPESLNVQMPTLKQNLLTNRPTITNNDDNSRCSTINGDSYHNNLDSNHSNDTLIYSQMNSSYNHFELKNSDQVLYNHNKNLLKKHEQQGLWYSQLQKCQQQDQSLRHHLKHEQRITEASVDNIDSICSISPSCYHKQDNNNNRQSKESQFVAIGDCSALYPFTGDGFESCYLAFEADEEFYILATDPTEDTTDWLHVCRKQRTQEIGYVPTAYVQKNFYLQPVILPKSEYVQLQDSDSSSTRTVTSTKPTLKKSVNTAQTSARSPVNSVHSNKSNYSGMLMMNRNFRGTSPYVRLSGVSRDTDL